MTTPHDSRSPQDQIRWIEAFNAEDTIDFAKHAVVEVVDAERPESGTAGTPDGGRTVLKCKRATVDSPRNTVVLLQPLKAQKYGGRCSDARVMYAQVSGQPSVNDKIGLAKDTTSLAVGYSGYIFLGDLHNGIGRVMVDSGIGSVKAKAQLAADMCQTGAIQIKNVTWDYTPGNPGLGDTPTTAYNEYSLLGEEDDKIEIIYNYIEDRWDIEVVAPHKFKEYKPVWDSYNCKLILQEVEYAAMRCDATKTESDVVIFEDVQVMADWYIQELCFYGTMITIPVPQGCDRDESEEQLECGTVCPTEGS